MSQQKMNLSLGQGTYHIILKIMYDIVCVKCVDLLVHFNIQKIGGENQLKHVHHPYLLSKRNECVHTKNMLRILRILCTFK
jgi:hypothetical protein